MKGLSREAELLHFAKDPSDSEWYVAQLAISETLAIKFSVPTPYVESIKDEEELGKYLERQAKMMIERYGDARDPRPDAALLSETAA